MPLSGGVQAVLQCPGSPCRGFTGLATTQPTYLCVVPAHPRLAGPAHDLGDELGRALLTAGVGVQEVVPPCRGAHAVCSCHALDVGDCIKVLAVLVDTSADSAGFAAPPPWGTGDPSFRVIPILTDGATAASLGPALQSLNAITWSPGDLHAVSTVLRAADMYSAAPRLFISYATQDSDQVARQLFDELHREGFDVFLDRFCIAPGVDFQIRLLEEMSNMGTLLVLESRRIRASTWVMHEVNFARAHRLGLMALQLPGGKRVPGIPGSARLDVPPSGVTKTGRLTKRVVRDLMPQLHAHHAVAERRRATYLRDAMADALASAGIVRQRVEPDNTLLAETPRGRFAFRLSTTPAALSDFHAVSRYVASRTTPHVVAPGRFMDWRRREQLQWLSSESRISLEDEGNITALARRLPQ